MADNKKDDLTRIEDLGEYIHELNEEEDDSSFEAQEETPPDFDNDMLDAPTDPNMSLPDELYQDESFESVDDSTADDDELSSELQDDSFQDDFQDDLEDNFQNDLQDDFQDDFKDDFSPEESFSDENTLPEENSLFEDESYLEEPEELTEPTQDNFSTDQLEDIEEEIETPEEKTEEIFHAEVSQEKTPFPKEEEEKRNIVVEDFSEVKKFASGGHYNNFAAEGNPPFSIIIKDIHYLEDIKEIIRELQELKLVAEDEVERVHESFMRGSFLISRISEFAAITLCHKLRRFNVTTLMGLSSEIHSSSADEFTTPIISKYSVYQNRQESLSLETNLTDLEHIVTSTTNTLEGHHILKYIDIISEHLIIDMDDFEKAFRLKEEIGENLSHYKQRDELQKDSVTEMNREAVISQRPTREKLLQAKKTQSLTQIGLNDFYKTLVEKLKTQAMNLNANGIVGISFMVNPLIKEGPYERARYQISATGNAVWAKPI